MTISEFSYSRSHLTVTISVSPLFNCFLSFKQQPGCHMNEWVVVVLRSPIHANEPSEYNGMLYRTSNRVLNNGIKVIILICMDGTSQYHHHQLIPLNHSQKHWFIWHCAIICSDNTRGWKVLRFGSDRGCCSTLETPYPFLGSFWQKKVPIFRDFSWNIDPFFKILWPIEWHIPVYWDM